ncbi:MAG: exosortase system-associated protein, TIGR04073 family, partial [Mariprofundales bacterium]|nr:exosortase system-associated protein, TIGR04073 family [Mariprofundales bacterium]
VWLKVLKRLDSCFLKNDDFSRYCTFCDVINIDLPSIFSIVVCYHLTKKHREERVMKNLQWIALILTAIFIGASAITTSAYAQNPGQPHQESYSDGVISKFGRGFANSTTGWLELPKNILNESRATNAGYGITVGLFKGVVDTIGRTLIGVVELGTFFIPNDAFIHPRFVWSPLERETTYGRQR